MDIRVGQIGRAETAVSEKNIASAVGNGLHERFIIDTAKFMLKAQAKTQAVTSGQER